VEWGIVLKDKIKNISLKWKLFLSFIIFTVISLSIIWIFETVFLDDFYENIKIRKIKRASENIEQNISNDQLNELTNRLATDGEFCIILYDENGNVISDNDMLMGCMLHNIPEEQRYNFYLAAKENNGAYLNKFHLQAFRNHYDKDTFEGRVPKSDPGMYDSLIYVKTFKVDTREYVVMINAAITPVSSTVETVSRILLIVTLILIALSLILALILSKILSKPISKLNNSVKLLATGNYNTDFSAGGYREISELSQNLSIASAELAKVDDYRRDLLANVSHDLRTPLTMISAYAEMMQDIPGENTNENLQIIIDESKHLNNLVNDILDVSKYNSGEFTINPEVFNLSKLLNDTMERYNKLREQDGYSIETDIEQNVFVNADQVKISQVIYNLVNNAINYTGEDKKIQVILRTSGAKARIDVVDNGEGIEADKLPLIWNRYFKIDKTHKRSQIGSGLGLSIVKTILEKHNLSYGANSKVGTGTDIWIEFPISNNN